MKDLRRAYLMAWESAEQHKGDFKDMLLHFLSQNLGMPVLNEVSNRVTDEGIEEMCRGIAPIEESESEAKQ